MDTCIDYAFYMLGLALESRLAPVAAAMDSRAEAVEDRSASARAVEIRGLLARLCRDKAGAVQREDVVAAYEASCLLLRDFWEVAAGDLRQWGTAAAPRAGKWALDVAGRAFARQVG